MSTIRPNPLIAALNTGAQPAAISPARASQSAFFRAALDGVRAPAAAEAAKASRSIEASPTDGRSARPGALLDIRV